MSAKGNCYDNAMVETFFKTLKSELVWRTIFYTGQQATQAIGRYIDGFYNPVRRLSALDCTTPVQFEKMAAESPNAAPLNRTKSRHRGRVIEGYPMAYETFEDVVADLPRLRCRHCNLGRRFYPDCSRCGLRNALGIQASRTSQPLRGDHGSSVRSASVVMADGGVCFDERG